MKTETIQALERQFTEFPRSRGGSVPRGEVEKASAELGLPFPDDYTEFLLKYGGAEVGPYPIFGLRKAPCMGNAYSVVAITTEFRRCKVPGNPNWLIISEDHAGNSVGLADDGKVYVWDHDFGQIVQIADGFEDYLRKRCLKL